MADVYRIVTPEGHVYGYHGDIDQLKAAHPGAVITGRLVMNEVGEGTFEPYSIAKAQADRRKAEADKAEKKAPAKKKDEAPADDAVAVDVVVEDAPAENDQP